MPTLPLSVLKSTAPVWARHFTYWHNCTRCEIGKFAKHHVFARGRLPCDILFLGEAPGDTENDVGYPFLGRAGQIFDQFVAELSARLWYRSLPKEQQIAELFVADDLKGSDKLRWAVANTVLCRPADSPEDHFREPTPAEKANCRPRLEEFVRTIAQPKVIFRMGKHAQSADLGVPVLDMYHPSYIYRNGGTKHPTGRRIFDNELSRALEFVREKVNSQIS